MRLAFAFIFLCVFGAFLVSCSEKDAVPHPAGGETGEPGGLLESLGVEPHEAHVVDEPLQASKPVARPVPLLGGAGFEITVIEDRGAIPAGFIRVSEIALPGGGVKLVFEAEGAPVSTSAMIEISFDAERFTPTEWTPGGFFGQGNDAPQSLARGEAFAEGDSFIGVAASSPGELGIGVFRIRPDEQGGASGDGVIASVTFDAGEFGSQVATVERELSQTAPEPEYFWDFDYGVVFPAGDPDDPYTIVVHDPMLLGDSNNDYEVTIADVAAIARHYLELVEWGSAKKLPHPYSTGNYASFADLDRSGEVNMADVAVVARSYNRQYRPDELAYRVPGGNWEILSEVSAGTVKLFWDFGGPNFRWLRMPNVEHEPDSFEYGLPYLSQSSGEQGALPYTSWPLTIFLDDSILSDVSYDPAGERVNLTIDLPDWGRNGDVTIADVAFITMNQPVNLSDEELSFFVSERFWDDLRQLIDVNNDGALSWEPIGEFESIIDLVGWHYLETLDYVQLDYYDTEGANQPIATVLRPYWQAIGEPEIEGFYHEEKQSYYCIGEAPVEAVEVEVSLKIDAIGEIWPPDGREKNQVITWPERFPINTGA